MNQNRTIQQTRELERSAIVVALLQLCDPLWTMDNLQVGDVVQLKSGGPTMTVNQITSGTAYCQWFDKDGALKNGGFQPQQLKKAEPQEGAGGGYEVRQR